MLRLVKLRTQLPPSSEEGTRKKYTQKHTHTHTPQKTEVKKDIVGAPFRSHTLQQGEAKKGKKSNYLWLY